MSSHLLTTLLFILFSAGAQGVEKEASDEKSWWQQRHDRSDIFYPHKAHFEVMDQEGDPCLRCHAFSKNSVTNSEQLKTINRIANEPLEAICHDCHVVRQTATTDCELCHSDMSAVWPADHDFEYSYNHSEAARSDRGECQQCHLELSFCSDCHFRRDGDRQQFHLPAYRGSHGIDARMSAISCSRCHNVSFCSECHRGGR